MSEKAKLTKEQAKAIERYPNKEDLMKARLVGLLEHGKDEPLAELKVEELAKALYIGYEVGPEFKVGDWVVTHDGNVREIVAKGPKAEHKAELLILGNYHEKIRITELRHATPEEIAKEKERRWWREHGRRVNEYRKGDIIKESYNQVIREVDNASDKIVYMDCGSGFSVDALKLICFAEDRKDVKE